MPFHQRSTARILHRHKARHGPPQNLRPAQEARIMEVSDDNLWWAGGHFDGDGCIAVHYGGLTLVIGKAERGMASLLKMKELFGGSITKQRRKEVDNWQPSWQWRMYSDEARKLCERLTPYVHAKRPQFELAATMPPDAQCVQVILSHPEKPTTRFASVCEAERELGLTGWKIRGWAKRKEDRGGWTCELLVPDREAKRRRVDEIDQQLQAMKRVEHRPVDRSLPDAYFAGFFDADGCFEMSSKRPCVSAGQKYRAILDAMRASFGGSVYEFNGVWQRFGWRVGVADVMDVARRLRPHLVEKAQQADLVLAWTAANHAETRERVSALQRNKRKVMD